MAKLHKQDNAIIIRLYNACKLDERIKIARNWNYK